jgi:maltokinase
VIDGARWTALLEAHLPDHLVRQRWAGAIGRSIVRCRVEWLDVLRAEEPLLAWSVVEAGFADGGTLRYQLFVGARGARPWPEFLEGKDHQVVATVPDDGRELVLYDALVDPDLAIAVLHLVSPGSEVEVRRPIVLESSNSSVVFDEATILKVFRKIEPGPNPDMEITRVLAARGSPHVLPPLAELRRDGTDLAVLRPFLVGATEGWQLARTSVRDMLASRLPPEDSGGDLAPESTRLGATIAGLHLAMADVWGTTPGDARAWVAEMERLLDSVEHPLDTSAIRSRLRAAAAATDAGQEILVHGDLHLGQVVQVDAGWLVLDFEGEPARRRDDRFTRSSPLRDVAGILRSLHYAAATGLAEWDLDDDELHGLLAAWEERNRDAFVEGYLSQDGIDALLPADPAARAAILAAFELDKAVYELTYELAHRPELSTIPLAGIERVLRGPVPT